MTQSIFHEVAGRPRSVEGHFNVPLNIHRSKLPLQNLPLSKFFSPGPRPIASPHAEALALVAPWQATFSGLSLEGLDLGWKVKPQVRNDHGIVTSSWFDWIQLHV
jgi:hypothetical protein